MTQLQERVRNLEETVGMLINLIEGLALGEETHERIKECIKSIEPQYCSRVLEMRGDEGSRSSVIKKAHGFHKQQELKHE